MLLDRDADDKQTEDTGGEVTEATVQYRREGPRNSRVHPEQASRKHLDAAERGERGHEDLAEKDDCDQADHDIRDRGLRRGIRSKHRLYAGQHRTVTHSGVISSRDMV